MISQIHKCIFIHIPKTAGMSIELTFLKSLGLQFVDGQADELLLSYNKDPQKGPPSLAHLSPEEYVKFDYVSVKHFEDYFKFTFIRDPWYRTISIYKHFGFHRLMSFTKFLKYEWPLLNRERYYFIRPQVEYIFDDRGNQLVDFIGRYENLNEDFNKVQAIVEHPIGALQHINDSKVKGNLYSRWNMKYIFDRLRERPARLFWLNPWARKSLATGKVYDERSKNKVQAYYHQDIEYFNYPFPKELSK